MNQWKKTAGATLFLLMATAAPAWADTSAVNLSVRADVAVDHAELPVIMPGQDGLRTGGPENRLISLPATLLQEVQAGRARPVAVAVNGKAVAFDQLPVVSDGVLLVPLRAVVEAAGGQVQWNVALRQDATLDLVPAPAPEPSRPNGGGAEQGSLTGTIQQLETGAQTRILVAGAAMANGEPSLTWITIDANTPILVQQAGQEQPGTVADLSIGQRVDVQLAGPVMMSYPALAGGASVWIRE